MSRNKERLIPRSLDNHQSINHDATSLNLTMPSPLPSYSSPNHSQSLSQTSKLDKLLQLSFDNNHDNNGSSIDENDLSINTSSINTNSHHTNSLQSDSILPAHISSISSIPKENPPSTNNETNSINIESKKKDTLHKLPSLFTIEPPMPEKIPSSMSELLREWGVPSPVKYRNESKNDNINNNNNSQRMRYQSVPSIPKPWNADVFNTEHFIHDEIARVRQQAFHAMESIRKKLLLHHSKTAHHQPRNQELHTIYNQIFTLLNDATQCFQNISKLVDELNTKLNMNNSYQSFQQQSSPLMYQPLSSSMYQQYSTPYAHQPIQQMYPQHVKQPPQQSSQQQPIYTQSNMQQPDIQHSTTQHPNFQQSTMQQQSNYAQTNEQRNINKQLPQRQQQQPIQLSNMNYVPNYVDNNDQYNNNNSANFMMRTLDNNQLELSDKTISDLQFLKDLETRVKEAWSTQMCSPRASKYVTVVNNNDESVNDHQSNTNSSVDFSSMPGEKTLNDDDLSVEQLLKRSEANFRRLEKSLAKSRNRDMSVTEYKPLRASNTSIRKKKRSIPIRDTEDNDILQRWV